MVIAINENLFSEFILKDKDMNKKYFLTKTRVFKLLELCGCKKNTKNKTLKIIDPDLVNK